MSDDSSIDANDPNENEDEMYKIGGSNSKVKGFKIGEKQK